MDLILNKSYIMYDVLLSLRSAHVEIHILFLDENPRLHVQFFIEYYQKTYRLDT